MNRRNRNKRDECGPAILECEHGCGFQAHIYVGLKVGDADTGCAEIYKCTKCKGNRKWGMIDDRARQTRLNAHPGTVE
jgi:DNA-directed RNA polymerase subunit M/transcription elongation factor TFIIS